MSRAGKCKVNVVLQARDRQGHAWLVQAGLFAGATLLYLKTLAPGLTWRNNGSDGGDLITAAANFGIPHPSGYPTYMILARAILTLPVGTEAYRLNLLSALCAALAAAIMYQLVLQRLSASWWGGRLAALTAAMCLAITPEVWSQATITEVYSLNLLFVVLVLAALARWRRRQGLFDAAVAGVLLGLGLGNHLTLAVMVPVTLISFVRDGQGRGAFRLRGLSAWSAGLGLGLSVYLYLPLASRLGSSLHWGQLDSLPAFVSHVGGSLYGGYVFGLPTAEYPARLAALGLVLLSNFQAWGILLAAIGLLVQRRRDPGDALVLILLALASAAFALGYNTADSLRYLVPFLVAVFIWFGLGLEHLLAALVRARNVRVMAMPVSLALVLLIAVTVWSRYGALDLSTDSAAEEFAKQLLGSLPAHTIVLSATDEQTFALWYFTEVRHLRTDVVIVDRDLLAYEPYRSFLQSRWPALPLETVGSSASATDSNGVRYQVVRLSD